MKNIKTYTEFLNEAEKYSQAKGQYIDSDYRSRFSETNQKYANLKSNKKLKVLRYIFDAGEAGRSYTDIQRFYYEIDGKTRVRRDYDEYEQGKTTQYKDNDREYNSTKDRGMGATMLSGSDYARHQTGMLHAHATKNADGKWVLTDRKLIGIFNFSEADDDDIKLISDLGLFD
jgi:hypothetical protein